MKNIEKSVMENSINIADLEIVESKRTTCTEMSRILLGRAYTIDDLGSDRRSSRGYATQFIGTGWVVECIQNGWEQLGGVVTRSPKRQYDLSTKTAQKILKYVCAAVKEYMNPTTKWTASIGPNPSRERNRSQRARNEVAFRNSAVSTQKSPHLSDITMTQFKMLGRH